MYKTTNKTENIATITVKISITQASPSDAAQWDAYVNKHPKNSPYHLYAWSQAVVEAYGHKSYLFVAKRGNTIVGILPIIKMSPPLLANSLCSLPFCDAGGCLANDSEIKNELIRNARKLLKMTRSKTLDIREAMWRARTTELESSTGQKVLMILALPDSAETLLSSFKSKLRSQIRKAEKNSLTVSLGVDNNHLDDFYDVFTHNMRRLGSPAHSRGWFQAILEHYKNGIIISVIKHSGLAIGAGIVIFSGNKATIPWASTKSEYNRLAPNMLLYWSVLEHATQRGCKHFDFGRSTYGEGTYKFKQQWGAKPVLLRWTNYPEAHKKDNDSTQPGKLRPVIENVWRKLPLKLTVFLGPLIRKHISL